jgi:hypothetical protein
MKTYFSDLIKQKIKKIRDFLNNYRVFFELIVATLLSIMAIIVSINSNRIANAQTDIMKKENMPQFEIRMTQDYNEQLRIYDNNVWMFFNRGGRLSDFDTKEYSFFKFTYHPHFDILSLPLYNYLNMRGVLTGESEGLIYHVDNNHFGARFLELRDSLSNFGYFEIETYISITYVDIFDEKRQEYFQVNPSIKKIDLHEWNIIENNYKNAKKYYDLPLLNTKNIIEMINGNIN